MSQICIVIPCYNEASRMPFNEFDRFISENSDACFCFVNDGSLDNTLIMLNDLKSLHPDQIMIVNLNKNSGKGEAVRQGMLQSLNWKSFLYTGFLDADLATPLTEVGLMKSKFREGYNIIIGSRVKRLGATIERSIIRHYAGRVFATFASIVMHIETYDSQCGAKLFDTRILPVLFREPFISKWIFDVELLIRAKRHLKMSFYEKVYEMPVSCWIAKKNSRIKLSYLMRIPIDLILIYRKYKR
ncbi:MAG: glycosyltransferase [Bacteroidales bacterium]|nr:glycosyltransferase [Bacteroidales bacterium]